jgi:molybdate transport system substrate-binding protein
MAATAFLCSTALKSSLDEVLASFPHQVDVRYGPSAQLTKRLAEGEAADAVVLTGPGFDEMATLGKVLAASRLPVARSATMVAVKQGAPRPDISTAEKLKQALLAARAVAYSGPGAGVSGAHIARMMERLGIADAMKGKTVLGPGGPAGLIGNYLVRGEVEIGFQQDSELMAVPGVDIVGPLPGEFALVTEFVFGVTDTARDPQAASALGAFLRAPATRATMQAKGLTPG